jgi:DNA-binding CsgD family transcriptional regulator
MVDKLQVRLNDIDIAFTHREYATLLQLAHGKTFKEAAQVLQISPRTVETHINKMKNKTNFPTSKLIRLFWQQQG